ncbi:site-specific integrase [Sphingomonas agri]|uniref:site-specific integrase n=1 Tax=Sphingomonas agri TaxID=1813878 RepID=UPI00311DD485
MRFSAFVGAAGGVCAEASVAGATPKTLRHTMLTWLAERGVPYEQRQMLAGHARTGTTARNYEHLSPSYLKDAVKQIDAFFRELAKHSDLVRKGPSQTR